MTKGKIKVLMFGWEFPPFNSGGLGVACYGITRELAKQGVEIIFVLPKRFDVKVDFLRFRFASDITVKLYEVDSALYEYVTSCSYKDGLLKLHGKNYSGTLLEEVKRYALQAKKIAQSEEVDIVHAHDWLTFPAGILAAETKLVPLVVHVHSTEFDRTGGNGLNQNVYEIEREGVECANKVIAVSGLTKNMLMSHYGVPDEKVAVIYNGVDASSQDTKSEDISFLKRDNKVVLFVGRLTLQKGCDYFLQAASKVLKARDDVIFVVSGSGDMRQRLIEDTISLGISDKVIFTGFLRGEELEKVFRMADLFVMPSVSEPFGIASLEALINGTPIIISKQSGVSEVIRHALKVDFWDTQEMANKIIATLAHPSLHRTLRENGQIEAKGLTWSNTAEKIKNIYEDLLR